MSFSLLSRQSEKKQPKAMVDCRSLIEFCRSFEQHCNMASSSSSDSSSPRGGVRRSKSKRNSINPLSHPFCDHSPSAAVDAALFLLVLGAIAFLAAPYLNLALREASGLLPPVLDAIRHAPIAYAAIILLMLAPAIAASVIVCHQARKCGRPYCRGLRKAVEFDIQLEPEECLKRLPAVAKDAFGVRPLELGEDHKELEAELKKMAPLNGRTVLILRAPCGCPAGRMEVWGAKKIRRIKK